MNKHSGSDPSNCPLCCAAIAKRDRYEESPESYAGFVKLQRHNHFASLRRQANDDAMRSLGLKKVRGAVSGKTYWE